jgi:DNA-binding transcriptional LysR family regulator
LRTIPYGIQQPAISTQLGRLEESLGQKLFQRRPFHLTPTGRRIYQQIAPFFSSLPRLADDAQREAAEHLRLAASPSVLRDHFPGLLRRLQRDVAALRVTLREGDQTAAERMLIDQEIDLGLALLENKPLPSLQHEVLIRLPMVLLVKAQAAYANSGDVLRDAAGNSIDRAAGP